MLGSGRTPGRSAALFPGLLVLREQGRILFLTDPPQRTQRYPQVLGTFPNMKEMTVIELLDDVAEELGGIAAQARFGDLEGAKLHSALKRQAERIEAAVSRLRRGEP